MKTTLFGVLLDVTPDQDTVLRRLMRPYGFMLRFAFQRLVGGLQNIGGLERHGASETELPLRYAKDAVQEAQDLIRARDQAMQDGLTLWTQRVKKPASDCKPFRPRHTLMPGASPGKSGSSRTKILDERLINSMWKQAPFLRSSVAPKRGGWTGSRPSMTPSLNRHASKRGRKSGTKAGMGGCLHAGTARKKEIPSCVSAKRRTIGS